MLGHGEHDGTGGRAEGGWYFYRRYPRTARVAHLWDVLQGKVELQMGSVHSYIGNTGSWRTTDWRGPISALSIYELATMIISHVVKGDKK